MSDLSDGWLSSASAIIFTPSASIPVFPTLSKRLTKVEYAKSSVKFKCVSYKNCSFVSNSVAF